MKLVFHNGQSMKAEPVNMSLEDMRKTLRSLQPVRVVLEPGDMTRYELFICPERAGGIWVARVKDDFVGAFVSGWWDIARHIKTIAGPNIWSQQLLTWWLKNEIFDRYEMGKA